MSKYIRHWTRDMIQNTIDDGTFLDYIITDDTHLNKHTHNTESQNLDRIVLERKKAQGLFTDNMNSTHDFDANHEHAMMMLDDAIYSEKEDIANWMMEATEGEKQAFHIKFKKDKNDIVGTGMIFDNENNMIKEYETYHLTFVLKKDTAQPNSFYLVTAYPDLEHPDVEPTGRDLTPFIKDTQAYKSGDDVYKTYLRYITDVNNTHTVTYKPGNSPNDSMMMIHIDTQNPNIYHEIKIKNDKMTMRTLQREYDDRGHVIDKTLIRTEYNDIYENQTGRTNTRYIDFNNEAVFQKFVNEYSEMKTPLTNIRNHFNKTRLQNQQTLSFDVTKTMSDMDHKNMQNQTSKPSKTADNVNNVQHDTTKCPTSPARKSTASLERIASASHVAPEIDNQFN